MKKILLLLIVLLLCSFVLHEFFSSIEYMNSELEQILPDEKYDTLTSYQKKFISVSLEQSIIGNILPYGCVIDTNLYETNTEKIIENGFINVTTTIKFFEPNGLNAKEDILMLFFSNDDCSIEETVEITCFQINGTETNLPADLVSFDGKMYKIYKKNLSEIRIVINYEQPEVSQATELIMGYFHKTQIINRPYTIRMNDNSVIPSSTKWDVVTWQ